MAVVERAQRFSQSLLWKLQRRFFEQRGMEARSQAVVPHYVTSNPFIADAYARVVRGFVRDHGLPVRIVELGAGSGRFAFQFLKRLERLLGPDERRFKYVLTDFAARNLDAWRSHPSLTGWIADGVLDLARFDVETDDEIRLERSGERLGRGLVEGPLVVLANYVFDGIPQDLFYVEEGRLEALHVTLTSTEEEEVSHDDPALLSRLTLAYERHQVSGSYYADPELDGVLEEYRARLGSTVLSFPSVAMRCLQRLNRWARGPMLVLSGDKAWDREESLGGRGEPRVTMHGSLSMMVNHHALARMVLRAGGQVLGTQHLTSSLNVIGLLTGEAAFETGVAFEEAIERFGPDDFFLLKKASEGRLAELTLPQLLAYLRLTRWDPKSFLECHSALSRHLDTPDERAREDVPFALDRVWDNYYPIGESVDVAFAIASLLVKLGSHASALTYFDHSLKLAGPDAVTVYNRAMCQHHLGRRDDARRDLRWALALDPNLEPANRARQIVDPTP